MTISARRFNFNFTEDHMTMQSSIIALATSAVLSLAGTMAALAHAHLVRAVPAVGGTVHDAPSEVTLRFSEKLEPKFSSVIVLDSTGKEIGRKTGYNGSSPDAFIEDLEKFKASK